MHTETINKIKSALSDDNTTLINNELSERNAAEIASIIISFSQNDICRVLKSLSSENLAEIILELPEDIRTGVLEELDNKSILSAIENLESDDAADLISDLEDEKSKEILEDMNPQDSSEVQSLLQYDPESAGGIMQTELVEVKDSSLIKDAINWIRIIAEDVPDFYQIYVTNENDKLVGTVSLKALVLATPSSEIRNIMEPIEISVEPEIDREDVSKIFSDYDLVSLPVIDKNQRLIGRITSDDILDVVNEEAEEDLFALAGINEYNHPIYSGIISKTRSRLPWLVVTLIGELIIAYIIAMYFQPTLEKFILLAAFMPAVMATGGSVGIQTSAIVIRALGTGTINVAQTFKVILSELKLSSILGVICGLVAGLTGYFLTGTKQAGIDFFKVIFLSLSAASLMSAFFGASFPLLLEKIKSDPANGSGPFVTMANDLFSAIAYLLIALLIM